MWLPLGSRKVLDLFAKLISLDLPFADRGLPKELLPNVLAQLGHHHDAVLSLHALSTKAKKEPSVCFRIKSLTTVLRQPKFVLVLKELKHSKKVMSKPSQVRASSMTFARMEYSIIPPSEYKSFANVMNWIARDTGPAPV